jgi:hypothetical protein
LVLLFLLVAYECILRHSGLVEFFPVVAAVAVLVGVLVGLTGVGAGALMTPILIVGFGVSAPIAIATDLLYATITKTVGGLAHMRSGHIQWKLLQPLWVGGITGAVAGSLVIVFVVRSGDTFEWLKYPLAALIALAAATLFHRHLSSTAVSRGTRRFEAGKAVAVTGGAGIGLGVSLTSVGAGALGMALLSRLSPAGTPSQKLVGTDLMLAIPIALVASVTYLVTGIVDFSLLLSLLAGSLPGVLVGSALSTKVPSKALGLIVASALTLAVIALLVG